MRVPEGESAVRSWVVASQAEWIAVLLGLVPWVSGRPVLIGIDGRGGSGKSTAADVIRARVGGAAVVHVDDLAWHEPYFEWGELLRDEVLAAVRGGRGLHYRPPQWVARGREGAIEVPAAASLLVVEGVGATQAIVADMLDVKVWVQSDFDVAEQRGIARDIAEGLNGSSKEATAFWHEWMAEELAFLRRDQPWTRADVVLNGTPERASAADQVAYCIPGTTGNPS